MQVSTEHRVITTELPLPCQRRAYWPHRRLRTQGPLQVEFPAGNLPIKRRGYLQPQIPMVREHGTIATTKTLLIPMNFSFLPETTLMRKQDPPEVTTGSQSRDLHAGSSLEAEQTCVKGRTAEGLYTKATTSLQSTEPGGLTCSLVTMTQRPIARPPVFSA